MKDKITILPFFILLLLILIFVCKPLLLANNKNIVNILDENTIKISQIIKDTVFLEEISINQNDTLSYNICRIDKKYNNHFICVTINDKTNKRLWLNNPKAINFISYSKDYETPIFNKGCINKIRKHYFKFYTDLKVGKRGLIEFTHSDKNNGMYKTILKLPIQ